MKQENAARAAKSLSEFDADLAKLSIRGQWQYDAIMEKLIGGPKPSGVPHVWRWEHVHEKLMEACGIMPESYTARRNLSFINPGLEKGGTTHTVLTGMQVVMPGEVAWAHRHSISALRFVVEGDSKLYTVVDGEALPMEPNDMILTPSWTWHDHHNDSEKLGIWLDALDVPLMFALNQMAYQPYGESTQPLRQNTADYVSERVNNMRPLWEQRPGPAFPYRYPWRDVQAQLQRFATSAGSPCDGVILEYTNPLTGGAALPTLRCCIQQLRPGFVGEKHRHTSSSVYYVVEGQGRTVVGDSELNWSAHDVFAVPNWAWHHHINSSQSAGAVLFSISDAPLLEAMNLYREEPATSVRSNPPPLAPANMTAGK